MGKFLVSFSERLSGGLFSLCARTPFQSVVALVNFGEILGKILGVHVYICELASQLGYNLLHFVAFYRIIIVFKLFKPGTLSTFTVFISPNLNHDSRTQAPIIHS
jgi:hypothetical protein